ncbi:MAG TPA: glycosyltransferase family 4 protein [Rhodocyclaceae bacterium]|jgi:glycosyltransferase involved in cell wall biosynthesis
MKPIHIVHTESSCGWGGQEIRILTEAEGMIRRGHRVTLICPSEAPISEAARRRGISVENLPIARKSWRGIMSVRHWLLHKRNSVDVVNTHSSTDSWLTALACLLMFKAPPVVRTRHVSSPIHDNAPTRWLYQKAARHVVVTGEALRHQLQRDNGFDLGHMTSVPTGIDLDYFAPADRQASRKTVGLVDAPTLGILATLRNWKGHVYLLEAFASLTEAFPEWRLLVVGDGPQRANLERKASELGIADRIKFVGNRDDVPCWLNCMDLFCLPSYGDEGVPQSIMQAMACGLAVVSTPVGAIAEAVVDGETGILVTPKDNQVLAQALGKLMGDETLRMQYAEAGLSRARKRFGVDIMLDRMEAIFATYAGVRD